MFSQEIVLSVDAVNTEIRSKRVELVLLINKKEDLYFNGTVKIAFGTNSSTLTTYDVGTISDTENYNLKTYNFDKENLSPGTSYVYKWWVESSNNNIGTIEVDPVNFTTPSGFDVLPYQKFEIPEEGLIPGDTIGFIKYEDTDGTWLKVQTYYKTSLGLKSDGSLWAWGRNSKRLVINPASESEVVYEPLQVIMPPEQDDFDQDGDGYFDADEDLNGGQSDKTDEDSTPTDSDGDGFFRRL